MKTAAIVVGLLVLDVLMWMSEGRGQLAKENDARLTTHFIAFSSHGTCSASAVGRHAVLTAAHCHPPSGEMSLEEFLDNGAKAAKKHADNFMWVDGNKTQILDRIDDGKDHVIYRTEMEFKKWANISSANMHQGDQFFIFGNPGHAREKVIYHDFLRRGYVSGVKNDKDYGDLNFLDMNGYYGDSGSALFNSSGAIVGMINMIDYEEMDEDSGAIKFMIAIDMNFRPDEIQTARQW